jgi:uncharacterized protein YdhG (YjbR/CyaY superfamily)
MPASKLSPEVDAYIASFPPPTRKLLQQLRTFIVKTAPAAEEVISYKMPAYKQGGMLVFFAGYEHHIGFYPTGSGIAAFKKQLASFKSSKGAVQFPLDQPLPLDLVRDMVLFKVAENAQKKSVSKKAVPKKTTPKKKGKTT